MKSNSNFMVFQKTRSQLLLSYLGVLTFLLGIFAVAVRIVFAHSLTQQLIDELKVLAQSAIANTEVENGHLQVESDFSSKNLLVNHQGLQWFDAQRHIIAQKGHDVLHLPLDKNSTLQVQPGRVPLMGITLPVTVGKHNHLIGYVRASKSLGGINNTLTKLDWGLGTGVVISLVCSALGGIWLTHQAMQPIEQSFQRLKQFTADASHELRSPLMAIKSNAAVALKYPQGMRATDAEKFQAIASAANQMARLTEDLLLLARTEQIPNSHVVDINLTQLLDSLVLLYKPQAELKQIKLNFDHSIPELHLLGDEVQLMRLFANLIENAIHYTPAGGTVAIKTSKAGRQLWVSVQDTGVGIAPEQLKYVFERFWRADASRSYGAGSGLGLAIAQAIAKNHGGLITVTSQVGVGSCFTVRLNATGERTLA